MHEEREQTLLCQDIKRECETNNKYKEDHDHSRNIKRENVTSDDYGVIHDPSADQDPLVYQDPLSFQDPIAISFGKFKKEEKDVKQEQDNERRKSSEDDEGAADLQHTSGESEYEDTDNIRYNVNNTELSERRISNSSILSLSNGQEDIIQEKQNSSGLPEFQHKHEKKNYKNSSCKKYLYYNNNKKYTCDDCDKSYSKFDDLRDHIASVHLKIKNYKCVKCKKLFFWSRSVKKHSCIIQGKTNKYECQVCNKSFSNPGYLKLHSVVHRERKFVCDDCGQQFLVFSCLKNHISEIHCKETSGTDGKEQISYKINYNIACGKCDMRYFKISDVERHFKRAHSGKEDYKCVQCNKMFSQVDDLKLHIWEVHENLKVKLCNNAYIFECRVCYRQFWNQGNLIQHSVIHREKKFMCDECGKRFFEFSNMKNHLYAVHYKKWSETTSKKLNPRKNNENLAFGNWDMRSLNYLEAKRLGRQGHSEVDKEILPSGLSVVQRECNKNCYEESSDMTSKKMNSDIDDEKYVCSSCGQRYSEICNLKKHIKLAHLGLGNFKCAQCTNIFFQPSKLKKHTCNKMLIYKCLVCNKQFSKLASLGRHSAVHLEYACNFCSDSFSGFSNLKNHINAIHHERLDTKELKYKIYACGNCDERYSVATDLKNHIKVVHSGIGLFKCGLCSKTFCFVKNAHLRLRRHINLKHKISEVVRHKKNEKYPCDNCDMRFSRYTYLEQHVKVVHSQFCSYKCLLCNQTFSQTYDLKIHISNMHKICMAFPREVCNNQLLYSGNLKHDAVHKENTFVYNDYGKRIVRFSLLKNHITSTQSEKQSEKSSTEFSDYSKVKKSIFKCEQCKKTFTMYKYLNKHNCLIKYECQFCGKEFSHKGFLKRHAIVHTRIDDFVSIQANKTFVNTSDLEKLSKTSHQFNQTHYNNYQKEQKFVCDVCDKRFCVLSSLKDHIAAIHSEDFTMTNDKIYACDSCDERYYLLSDLRRHIKLGHSGIGHYKCGICSKTFSSSHNRYNLKRHINIIHKIRESNSGLKKNNKYACDECYMGYKDFLSIKAHIEGVHLRKKEYKCVQCDKIFYLFGGFKSHCNSNEHKNFQKFECAVCSKRFSHLSHLRSHVLVHDRMQKYVCELCKRRFYIFSNLKNHMNSSHIKNRDHQCEQCGKAFVQKSALNQHINIVHKKLRNFECQVCYKKFQAIHHLQNHIICVHEKVKNFVCDQCGNRFLLAHHLRNHVNAVHKGIKVKAYRKPI